VNTAANEEETPTWDPRPYVYFPLVAPRQDNPITRNLNLIRFEFVSRVDTVGVDPNIKKSVLLTSSKNSRYIRQPARISTDIFAEQLESSRFPHADIPIAVLLEGKFQSFYRNRLSEDFTESDLVEVLDESVKRTKIIVVGDGDVVPDILALAKALGGGMPLGAFISSHELMDTLVNDPGLGHLTTFGGHPVSCAAGMTALNIILEEKLHEKANEKGRRFRELMTHKSIKEIRGKGLFIALKLQSDEQNMRLFKRARNHGFITDLFLFNADSFRIAPPLSITDSDIEELSERISKALDNSLITT